MKMYSAIAGALIVGSSLFSSFANATPLFSTSGALDAGDPTQVGRLSRNAVPQDWTGTEPYPGVVNPLVTYHYHTYSFNVGNSPFVEITFDSTAATTFISAYQTSYLPGTSLALHWLGDAGTSGNYFGVDPLSFQVIAQANSVLVIVVNETTTNGGIGLSYGITADGFIDSGYDEFVAAAVPEPETLLLMLAPLGLIIGRRTRKGREAVAA